MTNFGLRFIKETIDLAPNDIAVLDYESGKIHIVEAPWDTQDIRHDNEELLEEVFGFKATSTEFMIGSNY